MPVHLRADKVSVRFRVYGLGSQSFKKQLISFGTGGRLARDAANHFVVQALEDVSLDLAEGDRLGIIGSNGSGKSTLLRVLAGIYHPDGGSVCSSGKMSAIIDHSVGLDPMATGYENIEARAVLMRLHREARGRLVESVKATSELGDYLSMPVHAYSSGMLMRLNFSLSIAIDPDILLLDEWLSVADQNFRAKAETIMQDLVSRSRILVIASHNLDLLERLCDRVAHLEGGKLRAFGPSKEVLAAYRGAPLPEQN
jgi:lipopolysaccharide transport system ATP-binding protein